MAFLDGDRFGLEFLLDGIGDISLEIQITVSLEDPCWRS